MMQMTDQNQFTRSLSGSYKMTNDSHVCRLFFKIEGEAVKESIVRSHHMGVVESNESTETRSMRVSMMTIPADNEMIQPNL